MTAWFHDTHKNIPISYWKDDKVDNKNTQVADNYFRISEAETQLKENFSIECFPKVARKSQNFMENYNGSRYGKFFICIGSFENAQIFF